MNPGGAWAGGSSRMESTLLKLDKYPKLIFYSWHGLHGGKFLK
jgi:hypothetical protein